MPTVRTILQDQGHSNSDIKNWLKGGKIWYLDAPTSDGGRIIDTISDLQIKMNTPKMTVGRDPVIVHRDPHFVIVYKPTNYLAVPARGRQGEHSILSFVRLVIGEGLAVHRLDEGTSGLMMVATSVYGQEKLKELLEKREIKRKYLCISKSNQTDSFSVESHLIRNRGDGKRGSWEKFRKRPMNDDAKDATEIKAPEDSKWSRSHFRSIETSKGLGIFEVELETGRTHQIRIHGAENGCPILGDNLYAPQGIVRMIDRLALHSHQLSFVHFDTGEQVSYTAPLADDLALFWRQFLYESSEEKQDKRHKRSSSSKNSNYPKHSKTSKASKNSKKAQKTSKRK